MEITYRQITDYLESRNIAFTPVGKKYPKYKICSLFYPEPNGFYFAMGDKLALNLEKSLVLTNSRTVVGGDNATLQIQQDAQVVYYEMLDFYFKEESTGVISDSAVIDKGAEIGKNVQIDPFAVIGKCRIGDGSIIKSHTSLTDNCWIGDNVVIEQNCTIGATGTAWVWKEGKERTRQPQLGGVVVRDKCFIGANSSIVRGSLNENTTIGKHTIIAPGARIGHGTQIGHSVHFANNVVTGGNSRIGDFCFVGSSVTFRPKVRVHSHTIIGAGAVVVKNTSHENLLLMGVPAKETDLKENLTGVPNYKKVSL